MTKIVLLALADHANDEGVAWPGYDTLLEKTGMSRSTLAKNLELLCNCGLVQRGTRGEIGKGRKSNIYTISIRDEHIVSMRDELFDKIKSLEKGKYRPISSTLEPRKVQPSNSKSMRGEPEPSFNQSVKQQSENIVCTEYPKELNVEAFEKYKLYRKQARFKKLTEMGEAQLIRKLIGFGDHRIQEVCINNSIANGWQGVFSPKDQNKKPTGRKQDIQWFESAKGIEEKGKELGIIQGDDELFQYYKARVFKAAGRPL